MEAVFRHFETYDWITILIVLILLLLTFAKSRHPEDFKDFLLLVVSNKYFSDAERLRQIFNIQTLSFYVIGALVIALAISLTLVGLHFFEQVSFLLFLKVFILYVVFISSKFFIEKILANIFQLETLFDRYIFYKVTIKNLLNITLFPVVIILTYLWQGNPSFFKVLWAIFLISNLLFLMQFYRKMRPIILTNIFYFILYLCTFEMAPYYILYKVIV